MLKKSNDPEYEKLQKIKISNHPNDPKLFGYALKDVPRFLIFLIFANIIFGLYITSFYDTFGYSLPEFLLGIIILKLIYIFGDIYLSVNTYLNLSNYFDVVYQKPGSHIILNQPVHKNFLEYSWLHSKLSNLYNILAISTVIIVLFSIYKMLVVGSLPQVITLLVLIGSEIVSGYLIGISIGTHINNGMLSGDDHV